jgi:trigger factor
MKKGDQRKVWITVEESPDNRELTGGAEVYNVEVLQVVEFIIPELNDEFAISLGGYKDLADLREKTRLYLEKQAELDAEDNLKSDLIEEFIKHNPFEVPGSLVTRVLSADFENMKKNKPDQEINEEEYYTRMRPNAVRAVQTYLIIDKIKSVKNIDVTKEEISERIESIAQENGKDPREFRRLLIKDGCLDEIKNDIAEEKAYRWMVETAHVKVVRTRKKTEKSNIIIPNWRM